MALTLNERAPNHLQIIREAVNAALANLWTALPCEVVEYNSEAITVNVQPLIKIPVHLPDGEIETVELPMLLDVPVMFPCAGGFTITHPIKKGDECLVNFADRNIDLWWQSGGIQNPFDNRKHDLSDGFAFFRPQSQAKKLMASRQQILRSVMMPTHARSRSSQMVRFTLLAVSQYSITR